MNNDNYSLLQDLYLLVTATDILNENKRRELIKFLDVQIQIEEDVMFEHPNEFPVWIHKQNTDSVWRDWSARGALRRQDKLPPAQLYVAPVAAPMYSMRIAFKYLE